MGKTVQMVRHTRRQHLAGVRQEGLRCGLRIWGHLWMALRRPRHGALRHLRVLLGRIALGRLVASRHSGLLHLTWIYLLVLWGEIPVWGSLLGHSRRLRVRNGPGTRLIPLRQLLAGR